MIAMKFDKRFFFDRKAVENIVGKEAAKALSKAGAFVRTAARSSLRRVSEKQKDKARESGVRKPSKRGKPPRVWSDDAVATLKNIQFQFSPRTMSVLVGPVLLNGSGSIAIPGLHEHGMSTSVAQWRYNENWFRTSRHNWRQNRPQSGGANPWRTRSRRAIGKIASPHIETRQVAAHYPARPFMGPALAKEAPKFPTLFARSA